MLVELWLAVTWFMYSYNPSSMDMRTPMGQSCASSLTHVTVHSLPSFSRLKSATRTVSPHVWWRIPC